MKNTIIKEIRNKIKKKNQKKKNKIGEGFTLIELLAVIVILGLLMAIAIPSVTKYITESRKKTVVSTIGNYITAMINEVNDLTYTFTETNTIYAVPIECIALERGGSSPLGEWHQANDDYWAYVLIQYDEKNSSYIYGYTFKDSSGYGLYPTTQSKLNDSGKQIKTKLSLSRPKTGNIIDVTEAGNWSGFIIDDTTKLIVLAAESEGNIGNGKTTCTLCQKGENYADVEEDKLTCNSKYDSSCDKTPGVLSGKGTPESPYLIESMEDLVKFGNMLKNKEYERAYYYFMFQGREISSNFYVELAKNLDFKDPSSYVNANINEFGDVNQNGIVEPLITELNTGYGMPAIDSDNDENLSLVFDGKNHYLKNYNYNIINTDPTKTIHISLFGEYQSNFNVTNLILKDIDFNVDTVGDANISPLLQKIHSYDSDEISNITVNGKIKARCGGTCSVGGVANAIFSYGNDATKSISKINSNVELDIEGDYAVVGGITSEAENYGYYILDSHVDGDIKVKTKSGTSVGGVNGTSIFFKAVNTSVTADINVDTYGGHVYGIGDGPVYNSFYKGNIYVKSYIPINTSSLGNGDIYNSYAIGNITIDAKRRDGFPEIAGLTSNGNVYNSYYIGNIFYNTNTSYTGGGPTVLVSLLTGKGSTTNSFVRGTLTNTQETTRETYFGYLSTASTSEPTINNSYYTDDTTYTGNAPCHTGGIKIPSSNLNDVNWYKNTLTLDENWDLKNGYYPLINKCIFDPYNLTCTPTNDILPNQNLTVVE